MTLKITNNVTKSQYSYTVTDKDDSSIFYHCTVQLKGDEEEGDYDYSLTDGDRVLSTGLLRIGDFKDGEKTVYKDNDNKGYTIYGE